MLLSLTTRPMLRFVWKCTFAGGLLLAGLLHAGAQAPAAGPSTTLTVVDENGLAVSDAQVTVTSAGKPLRLRTDFAGHCTYSLATDAPYQLQIEKPGFYVSVQQAADPRTRALEVALTHEQDVRQQVTVTASSTGIDPERTSDVRTFTTEEIVNVPYPTSRDVRNLLQFTPGVVQDQFGQVHVAGSESYETLDLLDGFDVRSPISGTLSMRVSPDAVRSIDTQTTRYPVEFGRTTGGVVAFTTGMGDNKFHFNATNFVPSFRQIDGLRFDKFVPRFTFSGPLVRGRAWFFDGMELEANNIYVHELPSNANTNLLLRGSNLLKAQVNLTPTNNITGGMLFNIYHSPHNGLSSLVPQESTTKQDNTAWLVYARDQHSFAAGDLLDVGGAMVRFRTSYEPQGTTPFAITPEGSTGSYFENATAHSQREEFTGTLFFHPQRWRGHHDLKAGILVDHVGLDEAIARTPIRYLREDGTLLRLSTFPSQPPFNLHNLEIGAFVQDRWAAHRGLLLEPGLRFDWDQIVRRPLFSPRLAATWSPQGLETTTKLSAGAGLYYEHTQLEYLTRAVAGMRTDTYYTPGGVTPLGAAVQTIFAAIYASLHETSAINWSLGVEQKLPGAVFVAANFVEKRFFNGLVYSNGNSPQMLSGTYQLTNSKRDRYDAIELEARHTFPGGYTLWASYTRSSARTNAALNYGPTLTVLGTQQSGPLAWDTPNRFLSWGWLPLMVPRLRNNWDFVYTINWRTGFPFTAVNANQQVVGLAGGQRYPYYFSLSPGLEWRFHLRGAFFGLRGVLENATGNSNPVTVNNNVDSPQYGNFSQFQGRALTARLRLIGNK